MPINKQYKREHFDCGYSVLNDYIKKYARQNYEKGIAKTFVALFQSDSLKLDGYYTFRASVIEYESFPESSKKEMPTYPIPAILIGKLAVDCTIKGQGLEGELLVDALQKVVKASQEIGIFAVRVDAIDLTAKKLYLKFEFIPFKEQSLSLFLPLTKIL